jgi:hypothetical protein
MTVEEGRIIKILDSYTGLISLIGIWFSTHLHYLIPDT